MKTVYQIANEIGKSPQAVYKRLRNELNKGSISQLFNLVQMDEQGKIKPLDEKAEKAVKKLYNFVEQPVVEPDQQPLNNQVQQPNNNPDLLASVIETLQEQLKAKDEQIKTKDEQIKAKDEQISTLSKLIENTQVLLKTEQEKSSPSLLAEAGSGSEQQPAQKRSFIDKILRRK